MSEPVFLPGVIKNETDKAYQLKISDPDGTLGREYGEEVNNRVYWFPKSQCELAPEGDGLEVPDWLLRKKLEE